MAFDQSTRKRLQEFVSDARGLLSEEFTRQLQNDYGLDPHSGAVTPVESLGHLDDTRRETARILRDTLAHYLASSPSGGAREALDRIVREQAFTVLNRLAALRMAESRGILIESVGNGYQSKGFQLYERLAGPGLGETGDTYRCYLFSIFDEFALDLKVLFDRFSPQGRLFPRETALLDLLKLLNDPELAHLWAEDESIGWVYQYFNSKEERKKMRDESAAPRNSRELAVRNQFFTPRYVVEFLTDNTLGRIWYEMTQGETGLKESCRYLVRRPNEFFLKAGEKAPGQTGGDETLSQEELLKQPVYIQPRLLKDPRTLRMLDPACGSMHFGLYAFDLYEQIYDEAWELELRLGLKAFVREDGLNPLTESYSDKVAFLKDVPRLIIEHNIHGIDIDPRAAQIAGLSLWLRAQRSWHNQWVKPVDRPRITRSNIVCAEPMPGEKELLREFTSRLEVPALGYLVEKVFDKMQLAGEAGSLLKIEEEIRDIIAEAKQLVKSGPKLTQMALFGGTSAKPEQIDLPLDFTGITDERFWDGAEEKLYQALQDYAEVAGEHGYQRRMFAEDAARGFAFIDICRKRYDVVLMNPPFGASTEAASGYLDSRAKSLSNNILCEFVARGRSFTIDGAIGAITDSVWLKKADFGGFRNFMLRQGNGLRLLVDLGWSVLDGANVGTCCFVSVPSIASKRFVTTIRSQEIGLNEKSSHIIDCVQAIIKPKTENLADIYVREVGFFEKFPRCALAYETSENLVTAFMNWKPLEPNYATTRRGYTPGDTFRFFRCWWEIPVKLRGHKWWTLNNGGSYTPVIGDGFYVALHEEGWASYRPLSGFRLESEDWFGRPGLGWGKRTNCMYVYPLPAGAMFSNEGHSLFPIKHDFIWPLVAYLNSVVGQTLLNLYCGQHKEAGYVAQLPTPDLDSENLRRAGELAQTIWSRMGAAVSGIETQENFIVPIMSTESPSDIAQNFVESARWYESQLEALDTAVASIIAQDSSSLALDVALSERPTVGFAKELSVTGGIEETLSFSVGCAFGRWDIRYATGEKLSPELRDPFATLPYCPPGMLQNANGLPADPQDVPANYPLRITWPGILVDDEGHKDDIATRVRDAIEVIWKEKSGDIEHEACQVLGVRSLRDYFAKPSGFIADHLKRYSKSRRQAPIYWLLSTPSGSYILWLYYHRLTDQTLYTCVMEYVEPKLRDVAAELTSLRQKGSGRSRDDEKKLEKLQDFETELQEFRDELLRLARLPWKPNLNDGVQITAAPLWKLFQLPKWKKTLKETWEKLEKGEYDWAHLAYSIWPDRVKKKCVTDKSLAIAHDLEGLYVEPPASAKKKRGKKTAVVEEEEE